MAWPLLIVAGLLEVVWVLALQRSDGLSRPAPALLAISTAALSLALLSVALKQLPAGTAYAVWVGIGAAGVAGTGIVLRGDSAEPARLICLLLIVGGVVGLRLLDG